VVLDENQAWPSVATLSWTMQCLRAVYSKSKLVEKPAETLRLASAS
jgi:hypothetical protein